MSLKKGEKKSLLWLLFYLLLLVLAFNLFFGTLFYFFERNSQDISWFDSLWWAMITMTTIGYGDISPQTFAGRFLVTYSVVFFAIGLVGFLASTITEGIIMQLQRRQKGQLKNDFHGHTIICNLPSIARIRHIAAELSVEKAKKNIVLLTNAFEVLPPELEDLGIFFVYGEATSEESLQQAGLERCAGVFVLPFDEESDFADDRSYMICTLIDRYRKKIGRYFDIIVSIVSEKNDKLLRQSGANAVISPQKLKDSLLVQEFLYPGLYETLSQFLSTQIGCRIYIVPTPCFELSFRELALKIVKDGNLQLLGLQKINAAAEWDVLLSPKASTIIEKGDRLIVLASEAKDLESLKNWSSIDAAKTI